MAAFGASIACSGFRFSGLRDEGSGHATTLTVQALEMGFRSIVSVGGDGTQLVVNGCIDDQDNVVDDGCSPFYHGNRRRLST